MWRSLQPRSQHKGGISPRSSTGVTLKRVTEVVAWCCWRNAAGEFAGYVTVVWESDYPPFRDAGIPEIVDFNVLIKFQRQGVGTVLLDGAERCIAERSRVAGIGVGLTADYGAAQVLYVKRGYIPDGRGLAQAGRAIRHGEQVTVDDDLAVYFMKRL